MEAPRGHSRLSPEVWKEVLAHLPMTWSAMCCRVCKAWEKDLDQAGEGQGDDVLVDYGLATLCSALATQGVDEVMRRIRLHYPSGIAADLGRMDQARRFVQRHRYEEIKSVDEWMQLASQEPDAGWLCKGVSRTTLEGRGKSLMREVVGKPQEFAKLLDSLTGHSGGVTDCVAWSPDGEFFASAGDRTVHLWSKLGEHEGTLRGHTECKCKHRDDYGNESFSVNPRCPATGHSGGVRCVAVSPDGKHIASASCDKTVKIWDAVTTEEVGCLRGQPHAVTCVAYSPDGSVLACAGGYRDGYDILLCDPKTLEHKGTLAGHYGSVKWVAYSPDGKHIASAYNEAVTIWDAETKKEVCSLEGHIMDVTCVAYSPDGKHIASGSIDRTVRIWDAETKQEVCCLEGHRMHWDVLRVAYSPDGKRIASTHRNSAVKIWDAVTMDEVCSLGRHSYIDWESCVAWSPDGETMVSGSMDKSVRLWSMSGEHKGTLREHSNRVTCVAHSPDGKHIASSSWDWTVKIWDAETKQEVCSLGGHSRDNPDCTCCHYKQYHHEKVFANKECPVELHSEWNPECTCKYDEDCGVINYYPDRKCPVKGHSRDNPKCTCRHGRSGLLRCEVVANPKCPVRGHLGKVNSVAWSPDGELIATASNDKTVHLCCKTGEHKGTLKGHTSDVYSVVWSPDGETLASGSSDHSVRLWSKSGEHKSTIWWREVWQQRLNLDIMLLANKVKKGRPTGSIRTGQYIVTADDKMKHMVYVYRKDYRGGKQGEPLACFLSPAHVSVVSCKGTSVVLGCADGQVSLNLQHDANNDVL